MGVTLVTPLALSLLSLEAAPSIVLHVGLLIAGTACQMGALYRVSRLSARAVFGVACLAHLFVLLGSPVFEDDLYRFVWDGWRTLQTGTPYGAAPETFFSSPAVPPDYADVLSGINHPELATIYGPALQAVFAAGVAMTGPDPMGIRILFAVFNLGVIALLLRSEAPRDVALYAWSPIVVAEVALHTHPDGILALFIIGSLMLARRRPILAGILLGMAAGTKLVALAAWPLLLRNGGRSILAAALTLALLYFPFVAHGSDAGLTSTGTFASRWLFNPLGFAVFDSLLPHPLDRIAAGFAGIMLVFLLHATSASIKETPLAAIFAVALLIAPAVNAWYILWVLPFAVGRPGIWPWLLNLALPLSYLTGLNLEIATLAPFKVHPAAYALEVALILIAVAMGLRQAIRKHSQ